MSNRQLSGMSGVYYVAAELSKLGYIALVTTRNTKAADIIAMNDKTGVSVAIEVKTCGISTSDSFWLLSARDRQKKPHNFIYVFVKLNRDKAHDFYIVPAQFVAKNVEKQKAKTGSIWYYISKDRIASFKQKWDLIQYVTTRKS
ncbi:hypothetical protein KEJ37_00440 [Candidatus Bathyarchaeota archaeon]|nr:hypothetical protein [Candidatus Bathyarchaeota archaeon]